MNQKPGCVRGCLPALGAFVRAVFVALWQLLQHLYRLLLWWVERIRTAKSPLEAGLWVGAGVAVLVVLGFWAERTENGIAERSARWTATAAAEHLEETATALAAAQPTNTGAAVPAARATSERQATAQASDPSPTSAQAAALQATSERQATAQASDPSPTSAQAAVAQATAERQATAQASDPSPTPAVPAPEVPTAAAAVPAAPEVPTAAGFVPAADYPQPSDRLLAGRIVKVVDGDTVDIVIDGVESRVRLIGVDTPETVDPRKPVQCFGREASAYTRNLLDGQQVLLEVDPTQGEFDRYGRRLGYIWRSDGRLINYDLIRDGYAFEYTYNLPYRYMDAFKAAQRVARESGAGLWNEAACGGDIYRGVADAPTSAPTGSGSSGGSAGNASCARLDERNPAGAPNSPLTLSVDKAGETVTVTNISGGTVDLTGWYVCSQAGGQLHAVLDGSLGPGEQRLVLSTAGKAIWNNATPDPGVLLTPDGVPAAYWAD